MSSLMKKTDENFYYVEMQLSNWRALNEGGHGVDFDNQQQGYQLASRFFLSRAWQGFLQEFSEGYQIRALLGRSTLALTDIESAMDWTIPELDKLKDLADTPGSWLSQLLLLVSIDEKIPVAKGSGNLNLIVSDSIAPQTGSLTDIMDILSLFKIYVFEFRGRFQEW